MNIPNSMEFPKVTRKDVLRALGLEPRRTFVDYLVPAMGLLGAGILIGAGVGMLLAPRSGHELRSELGSRWRSRSRSGDGSGIEEPRLHS